MRIIPRRPSIPFPLPLISGSGTVNASGDEPGVVVGAYDDLDMSSSNAIYRVDYNEHDYPVWVTDGATETFEASGAWDGGACSKITPLLSSEGYNANGAFQLGAHAIQKLNIRFELYFGSLYTRHVEQPKFVIVHTSETVGGDTDERPMFYWCGTEGLGGSYSGQYAMAWGAASGTVKQYTTTPTNTGGWFISGNEPAYLGQSNTTINGKPVYNANQWFTVELYMSSVAISGWSNGVIRGRVTNRAGTVCMDIACPWTWDGNWDLGSYFTELQVLGGYQIPAPADANNYFKLTGVTFARDRETFLGPRPGFLT